jgi:hypothetical protein
MPLEPLIVPFGYRLKEQYRNGLVGHWKMNVNSGNVLPDLSGNNNHGTLTNMANPPTATSGWAGQGLSFDGVNDYVSVPNSASLNMGTNNFSYGLWFKTVETSATYLLGKGNEFSRIWVIRNNWGTTGRTACAMLDNGGWKYIENTFNTNDGQWHQVMCVKTALTTFSMYMDGKFINSNALQGNGDLSNTGNLFIGADWIGGQWGTATIDDVRIYNRALSAGEVAHSYFQQEDEWDLGLDDDIDVTQGVPIELLQSGNMMGVR